MGLCWAQWTVSTDTYTIYHIFQSNCDSGMARIFTAAPGLVKLMAGRPWAETQLPDVYQITLSRVNNLKQREQDSGASSRL